MKGTVHSMNPQRGMVAIETAGHCFTIIELLSDTHIDIGDSMEWSPDTGCGSQTYINNTKGSRMLVFAQNHGVTPTQRRQQLKFYD
jgi:hypothetical protein